MAWRAVKPSPPWTCSFFCSRCCWSSLDLATGSLMGTVVSERAVGLILDVFDELFGRDIKNASGLLLEFLVYRVQLL